MGKCLQIKQGRTTLMCTLGDLACSSSSVAQTGASKGDGQFSRRMVHQVQRPRVGINVVTVVLPVAQDVWDTV